MRSKLDTHSICVVLCEQVDRVINCLPVDLTPSINATLGTRLLGGGGVRWEIMFAIDFIRELC